MPEQLWGILHSLFTQWTPPPPTPPSPPQFLARLEESYRSGTSDIWESNYSWLVASLIASGHGQHQNGRREEEAGMVLQCLPPSSFRPRGQLRNPEGRERG